MFKKIVAVLASLALTLALVPAVAFAQDYSGGDVPLNLGQQVNINPGQAPNGTDVSWTTENDSIASIAFPTTRAGQMSNVITGQNVGVTVVKAMWPSTDGSDGFDTVSYTIRVTKPEIKGGLSVSCSPSSLTMTEGDSRTISPSYTCTVREGNNDVTNQATISLQQISFSSNNSSVASINSLGDHATVNGNNAGSTTVVATVTVSASYNGWSDTFTQSVSVPVTVESASAPITAYLNASCSPSSVSIQRGSSVRVTPNYAVTVYEGSKNVSNKASISVAAMDYSSSNPSVASVSDSGSYTTIYGSTAGSVTVTVNLAIRVAYKDYQDTLSQTIKVPVNVYAPDSGGGTVVIVAVPVSEPGSPSSYTYNGNVQFPWASNVAYSITTRNSSGYSVSSPKAADTYTTTFSLRSGYCWYGRTGAQATRNISYTWKIYPKTLTVPVYNTTKVYGAAEPTMVAGQVTGYIGYDRPYVKNIYRTSGSAVGKYPITIVSSDSNYSMVASPSYFTITNGYTPVPSGDKTENVLEVSPKSKSFTKAVVNKAKKAFYIDVDMNNTDDAADVVFKVTKGKGYITVNSETGRVTVKKGAPRGTYKVKVTCGETTNFYAADPVYVTIRVR